MTTTEGIGKINRFWREAGAGKWFGGGVAFDAECERFRDAHFAAACGECEPWLDDAEGALAVLILLDQIPRNLFRGSAHSWAADGLARQYAQRVIAAGLDAGIEPALRLFFYLPYEHSEALADQARSLQLFAALGNAGYLDYAQRHYDVIERFGRFPHRNAALGRANSPDEQAWLEAGGGF
ncbi:hypothetical protein CSC70_03215 [Pseudoxanthomonas kalamensis DSM 18571]|uniref:DUF924 family protein n=1 Tax=Pseudoxanthomonas kalamensis TaxID=289483 RepID=UPI0013912935|nr:DUF924 family protein [Pseudoxanthomonas kalamensis]KAF1712537.1 hypothetical protein CSC70_03215 [Pseudoxanthomonas kalamensis DSM 18571]